jgi:alpha-beta hydrolase superfamily lysophospholipase
MSKETALARQAPAPRRLRLPLDAADLQGLARLGITAVVGVTDVVEGMHHAVTSVGGRLAADPAGRTAGITGFVYRRVRGTARAVGWGLDTALSIVSPRRPPGVRPEREAFVAALNGVFGDHLADTANPLATPMSLRIGGLPWRDALRAPSGRVLVLVHGLAMNDLQWHRLGHDHGQMLASEAGFTPVYAHYNSGRHVAQNGRELSAQLDALLADWPVPVTELVLVGHSMGGLVIRSACHAGAARPWRTKLRALVCLGTPHHGAPLERGGHVIDTLLGISAYAAPLARLTRARSAGITDLRHGRVQDADGQHRTHHDQKRPDHKRDDRPPLPLPDGVACYLVAATRSAAGRARLASDGLVPVASALGRHPDPRLALALPDSRCHVVHGAHHWDLLDHPEVMDKLRAWLA